MGIIVRKSANFVQILCLTMKFRIIFTMLSASFLLCGCSGDRYETFSGYAQGGIYTVKVNMKDVSASDEEVAAAIDSLLDGIDFSISGYNRNSLLSRRNAGEEIVPDRYFSEITELSRKYKEMTGGAFDVAGGPLFDIWGFGFTADSLPSPDRIAAAMEDCRQEKVLNFNAIAQGRRTQSVGNRLDDRRGQPRGRKQQPGCRPARHLEVRRRAVRNSHLRELQEILCQGREEIRAHHRPAHGISCGA